MKRTIVKFERDGDGHWVAILDCGHSRHVRHEPPWALRPWVLTEEGRQSYIGTKLECSKCNDAHQVTSSSG